MLKTVCDFCSKDITDCLDKVVTVSSATVIKEHRLGNNSYTFCLFPNTAFCSFEHFIEWLNKERTK